MSEITVIVENDSKSFQESNLSEQAGIDTSVHMHAPKDEEKAVRGDVLCQEEERKTGRPELGAFIALDIADKSIKDSDIYGRPPQEFIVYFDFRGNQGPFQQGQAPPPSGFFGQLGQRPGQYGRPTQVQQTGFFGQQNYYGDQHSDFYSSGNPDRNVFVRKVTILVFIMLLFTCGFVVVIMLEERLKNMFARMSKMIIIGNCVGMIAMSYVFMSECSRRFPMNYLILIIITLLETLLTAAICVHTKTQILLQALLATMVVVFMCVCLAFSRFDFTKCILIVMGAGLALCVVSIAMMIASFVFNVYMKPLHIALTIAVTLISTVGLIIELQMVLGGKREQLDEDDYALGAFMLYTSIIQIFLNIVILLRLLDD